VATLPRSMYLLWSARKNPLLCVCRIQLISHRSPRIQLLLSCNPIRTTAVSSRLREFDFNPLLLLLLLLVVPALLRFPTFCSTYDGNADLIPHRVGTNMQRHARNARREGQDTERGRYRTPKADAGPLGAKADLLSSAVQALGGTKHKP